MKAEPFMKASCPLVLILLALLAGCTSKKSICPTEAGPFFMEEYFPLNQGDLWIYQIVKDSVPEPFVDGDVNLGEPFVDLNKNGTHDNGEEYQDLNSNGKYDGPNDPWTPGVPFIDRNNDGDYDPPNGVWDEGEFFGDSDSSGTWSSIPGPDTSRLKAEVGGGTLVSPDGSTIVGRRSVFLGTGGDFVVRYTDDGFSNDSLGLRWHSHKDVWGFSITDDLKDHAPIILARAAIEVGDSVINADTSEMGDVYTWASIVEAVEDVIVPAGTFRNCLRLKSIASGWTGNMGGYNSTIQWWYARDIGMIKLDKPAEGARWQLDSATVCGITYP